MTSTETLVNILELTQLSVTRPVEAIQHLQNIGLSQDQARKILHTSAWKQCSETEGYWNIQHILDLSKEYSDSYQATQCQHSLEGF